MADDLLKRVEILLEANTAKFETGMAKAEKIAQNSANTMTKGYDSVKSEVKRTQAQVDDFSRTLERQDRQISMMAKSYSLLASSVKSVVAGVSINEIIGKSDEYISLNNRLKLVTQSQTELAEASASTFNIAQKTGAAWDGVADIYSKFSANSKTLNIDQKETARLTETVAKATAMSGSSASAAQDALTQFGQALASNKLQAEEFNSMNDNASGVLDAMARGLGKTRGELRQMMLQGELTGDVIVKSLLKAGDSVDQLYNKTDKTVGQAFTKLNNELIKFVGEASKSSGASAVLVDGISSLADNLDKTTDVLMVGAAFYAGTYIPSIYNSVVAGYAKTKQLIEQTAVQITATNMEKAAALADVAKAQSTLTLIAAEKALEIERLKAQISSQGRMATVTRMAELKKLESVVTNELAVAQSRLNAVQSASIGVGRSLLGILGGPVGLGLTVAGVAASYLLLKDSSSSTVESLDLQKQSVDELRDKYEKLSVAQKNTTLHELKKQVDELRVSYTVAGSNLSAFVEAIPISDEKIDTVRKLYNAYSSGALSSDDFNKSIQKLNFLTDEQKLKINELSVSYDQSKVAYNNAKTARDALVDTTPKAVQAHNGEAEAIRQKNIELQKTKELQASAAKENLKNQYFINTVKASGSNQNALDYATFMTKFREDNKIPFSQNLTTEQKKIADKQFALQQEVKNLQDKITESVKAQTKEYEKQQKLLSVNATVQAAAKQYKFASLEQKAGFPLGTLSALMMQESRGNPKAYNPETGAAGAFQFLPATAKQYGVQDRYNVQQSAEGAIKYLSYLMKFFNGDLEKTIRAYHAGEGNVQKNTKIGPVNNEYWSNYKARIAFLNGAGGSTSKDFEKYLQDETKAVTKSLEDQQAIRESYYNSWEKLENEHNEKVQKVRTNFANDPKTRDLLLKREDERHAKAIEDWMRYEDNRVKEEVKANQEIIVSRELAFEALNGPMGQIAGMAVNATAEGTLAPKRLAMWKLGAQHQEGYSQLGDLLTQSQKATLDDQTISDQERYKQLNDTYREYLEAKKALSLQYAKEEQDLVKSQHLEQLNLWSNLLGQAQNTWSQLTQSVKDANGEQSAAYKAMFVMQQAFSIASTLVAAHVAAAQVAADATIPFFGAKIAASEAMLAMGYAQAGLIGAQTIAGIAHGGLDYVPSESTYLLDEGERVLSPRQNQDLTRFIANQQSGGSGVKVTINNYGNDKVETSQDADGNLMVTIGKMVDQRVDAGIARNLRQGYPLANAIKGK
ncbi:MULTISPECIES: tape measure protein [Acinetobacter calcoaceticus/baumannii complex]|uniref:tape measure protein n=1 Tax=Acinetobacter calcoaceticus/baumannii complex TaxID=909768 RepID=UPI0024DE7DE7|nr:MULTISPECIES: tape measure protein [Acinetobacter calcoaceticus/baumannii complex]MDR0069363.1 tape measure protein [Acinetobacter sp. 11520]HAV4225470.1 tape measure protein [Acinetobacter baumannii]